MWHKNRQYHIGYFDCQHRANEVMQKWLKRHDWRKKKPEPKPERSPESKMRTKAYNMKFEKGEKFDAYEYSYCRHKTFGGAFTFVRRQDGNVVECTDKDFWERQLSPVDFFFVRCSK